MPKTADDYIECHAIGHAWYVIEDQPLIKLLRCNRCAMKRLDQINLRGGLQNRQYEPPPGYADEQTPRRTKDEWRVLYFNTLKAKRPNGASYIDKMMTKKRIVIRKKPELKLIDGKKSQKKHAI